MAEQDDTTPRPPDGWLAVDRDELINALPPAPVARGITPLRSGGFLVDLGDPVPVRVDDIRAAHRLRDCHDQTTTGDPPPA